MRLLLLASTLLLGCSDVLGLSELAYDVERPSQGGAGGTTSSGGGGAIGGGGAGAGGQGGGAVTGHEPVQVTGGVDLVTVAVNGLYELVFARGAGWGIEVWEDLASAPGVNLAPFDDPDPAGTHVLLNCFRLHETSMDVFSNDDAKAVSLDIVEANPARVVLLATVEMGSPGRVARVESRYTIYASGRMGLGCRLINPGETELSFEAVDYLVSRVAPPDKLWSAGAVASGDGAAFLRDTGPKPRPNLLTVNHVQPNLQSWDQATHRFWVLAGPTVAPLQAIDVTGEVVLAPAGSDLPTLASRADDALQPELDAIEGVTAVAYLPAEAAYQIETGAARVVFGVAGGKTRHSPVFRIDGWMHAAWTLANLDGQPLASSAAPIAVSVLSFHDQAAGRLLLVFFGDLPAVSPAGERTFVLEAE